MALSIHVTELTLSDGTRVPVERNSIVVFAGPNNSGKSRALRDIDFYLSSQSERQLVVTAINLQRDGAEEDLTAWVDERAYRRPVDEPLAHYTLPGSGIARIDLLRMRWRSGPPFHELASTFRFVGTAENRLTLAAAATSFDAVRERPSTPLQVLYAEPEREAELSDASMQAFGVPVTVNRFAGNVIHLHFGAVEASAGQPVPTNAAYLEALSRIPLVEQQGDGVRSFLGLMLALVSAQFPLVLIDEPEAFLHPPQARLLGRKLATLAPANSQLFVATHSIDVLRGLLDASTDRLTVIRLTRDGDVNPSAVLDSARIRELWDNPLLRYSQALDGLFHEAVVVCEGDADCRFYAATLDSVRKRDGDRPADLLFTHTGGKARMATVVRALRAVGVPVRTIPDLDILRDEREIAQLVEAHGGEWSDFARDWRIVNAAVSQRFGPNPPIADVRRDLIRVLDASGEQRLTRAVADRIRSVVRAEDGWGRLRASGGVAALPGGDATAAAWRLLAALEALGILIVPVGELERWGPGIGSHGPAWVSEAVSAGVHEQEGEAAAFMRRLTRSLSDP